MRNFEFCKQHDSVFKRADNALATRREIDLHHGNVGEAQILPLKTSLVQHAVYAEPAVGISAGQQDHVPEAANVELQPSHVDLCWLAR